MYKRQVPSFIAGTLIGGSLAFLLLKHLQKTKMLSVFQEALGSRAYEGGNTVANDAIGIAFLGLIAALAVSVAVKPVSYTHLGSQEARASYRTCAQIP